MTTKKYIELLANNLELRKAQAGRLADLNSALSIMERYHVPENNPEYLKLSYKRRKLDTLLKWCDWLMDEMEYYNLSEGDDEQNAAWIEWWENLKEVELKV